MSDRVHEAITELTVGSLRVRAWTDTADKMEPGPDQAVLDAISDVKDALLDATLFIRIAKALDALPHVAAYEIKDVRGNGVVIYPRWP